MQELRESASVVVESTKVIYGNTLEHFALSDGTCLCHMMYKYLEIRTSGSA